MIEKDEDIEYGKWRQRRLDALDEEIAKDKHEYDVDQFRPMPQFAKDKDPRPCTCHPGDNPPVPCAKQYALTECRKKAAQFAKHEGPQKFATRDPWPNVPWREEEVKVPTLWGALIVLLIVVGGFMLGLLWEVL